MMIELANVLILLAPFHLTSQQQESRTRANWHQNKTDERTNERPPLAKLREEPTIDKINLLVFIRAPGVYNWLVSCLLGWPSVELGSSWLAAAATDGRQEVSGA